MQVENTSAALRNMQHLCNLLRPVQARQTLVHTLAAELEQRRRAVQELRCGSGWTGWGGRMRCWVAPRGGVGRLWAHATFTLPFCGATVFRCWLAMLGPSIPWLAAAFGGAGTRWLRRMRRCLTAQRGWRRRWRRCGRRQRRRALLLLASAASAAAADCSGTPAGCLQKQLQNQPDSPVYFLLKHKVCLSSLETNRLLEGSQLARRSQACGVASRVAISCGGE